MCVVVRMFSTMWMLSANPTPILLNGKSTGPIENGMTYIVRPFIEWA